MFNVVQAATVDANTFGNAISPILNNVVNPLIELLFAVALIVFVYGVVRFISKGDVSDAAREQAKLTLLGGLVGMFLMLSAWGIIHLVANTIKQF